jgi:threonine dehydrogenase-like Zn-dependent dehydrogenase
VPSSAVTVHNRLWRHPSAIGLYQCTCASVATGDGLAGAVGRWEEYVCILRGLCRVRISRQTTACRKRLTVQRSATMATANTKILKVAIVGAGPGGLAAAILLSRLPFVELSVFEQARELREVGAVSRGRVDSSTKPADARQGISINQNTWRLLQVLGAADSLEEFSKRGDGSVIDVEQRWVQSTARVFVAVLG